MSVNVCRDPAAAEAALRAWLSSQPAVLVAFSGGVDSTYLLAVAAAVLGPRCTAVIADSPSLPRSTLAWAEDFCRGRGIALRVVPTDEADDPRYTANTGLRCAACKAALLRAMHAVAAAQPAGTALLVGAVLDDFGDIRPGITAARELGAAFPLAEHGLDKQAVRVRSHALGLPDPERPAQPCLSSRVPYGEPVSAAALGMIEAMEEALKKLGVRDCRARHHAIGQGRGSLCRIEVPVAELATVLAARETLTALGRRVGYLHVSVDLGGLASGGLNALLSSDEQRRLRPEAPHAQPA
jgi:uncharacterized protein